MAGRVLLAETDRVPFLPLLAEAAPPPPPGLVNARIDASSGPGEVVLDPFGRGGWVARAAIDRQRKAISLELSALDRLLAEVVLRPPDLRHLDAAVQILAATARRETSLKAWIADRFASRCGGCGRTVVLEEVGWSTAATEPGPRIAGAGPVVKRHRCPVCRDQLGGGERRESPLDAADLERAAWTDDGDARRRLLDRFPEIAGAEELPGDLLDLHTPRQLAGLHAILELVEGGLRASPIVAALRLALLQAILPASRLANERGGTAPLRVAAGRLRQPAATAWRERNPWGAFEEGVRAVRAFVQELESGIWGPVPGRLGDDLRSITEGSATVVLKQGTSAAVGALQIEVERAAPGGARSPVRLVLGAAPPLPDPERLARSLHGTAWVLGRTAAATVPVEPLVGPAVGAAWAWQAATITRSLRSIEPLLARDARVVVMVEGDRPEALVAAVLGGVSAGYRLTAARLPGPGPEDGGVVELVPPGSGAVPGGPRTRAGVALPPEPGGAGDPDLVLDERRFGPPVHRPDASFSRPEAARAVVDAAVEVLKLRGEPVGFEALVGELLVGLDRTGHLRRLVRTPAGPGSGGSGADLPADGVERLLELVRGALDAGGGRLARVPGERWWLAGADDREAAAAPLADRVEWAVYSLLSTAGPLSEGAFRERIAGLFTGPDLPDDALVAACLESYRSPRSAPDRLVTEDDLATRTREHGELVGTLVELGHRLGFSCWIGTRQQDRRVRGIRLGDLLSPEEAAGPPSIGRVRAQDVAEVDVLWYVRGRSVIAWEVEWTAMLGDTILRRHARLPDDERLVRIVAVHPDRVGLVRHKLERSPLLRHLVEDATWHLVKSNHLADWAARDRVALADLEHLLGLDPAVERTGDQLPLFGG